MRAVKYSNNIVYFENVVKGLDLSSITYVKKDPLLGQNEVYDADINVAKNDENAMSKTLFYKAVFQAVHNYFREISINRPLQVWTKIENHLVQFPGTEDPQLKKRCPSFTEGEYAAIYSFDTVNDGGFITFPNQNFSMHLQENTMLIFPTGKDYEYNIHKIGGAKERKFIEMIIG